MSQTNPDRENFPTRNRIVAGLCDVLLVIETAERGGAMITAELANGYNKELMAVPGRVGDLYSAGCNKLIQQNKAAILTKPEDIISWMNWESSSATNKTQQELPLNLGEDELNVINYIRQKQKVGIDIMSHDMQIDSSNLSLILLGLEMQGLIRSLPGKNFELI
jgi:DNA processing protein